MSNIQYIGVLEMRWTDLCINPTVFCMEPMTQVASTPDECQGAGGTARNRDAGEVNQKPL